MGEMAEMGHTRNTLLSYEKILHYFWWYTVCHDIVSCGETTRLHKLNHLDTFLL